MDSKPVYMHQCKHGNPTSNSCSFCESEGRESGARTQRLIPTLFPELPELVCPDCGYTTFYADAMRRHVEGSQKLIAERRYVELIKDLPRHWLAKIRALARRLVTMCRGLGV